MVKCWLILIASVVFQAVSLAQQPRKMGKVTNSAITEISGIIPCQTHEGYFWVHNDSGDGAFIYLIDSLAQLKLTVELEGVNAIDCEDITVVKKNGKNYVLLADIGNNIKDREILSLYLFEEPKVDLSKTIIKINDIKSIRFKYVDKRRDAESIFYDPIDEKVYLISKRDFRSSLFSVSLDADEDIQTIKPIADLPLTFATAADVSPDGKDVLIKNLTSIYHWKRDADKSISEVLKGKHNKIPYIIEPQGEAICFDLNRRQFYTISERPLGLDSYLYVYEF